VVTGYAGEAAAGNPPQEVRPSNWDHGSTLTTWPTMTFSTRRKLKRLLDLICRVARLAHDIDWLLDEIT
jgi:hypothetical protein